MASTLAAMASWMFRLLFLLIQLMRCGAAMHGHFCKRVAALSAVAISTCALTESG